MQHRINLFHAMAREHVDDPELWDDCVQEALINEWLLRQRKPDEPESKALDLHGRDFSFDPRTMELRAESGGGQHGMSFDDWGRKFVSSNSDHIQMVMIDERYLEKNPYLSVPGARESIAADGPLASYLSADLQNWLELPQRGELSPDLRLGMEAISLFHSWCRRYRDVLASVDPADLLG